MLCVIAKVDDAARKRLDELCRIAEEFNYPARYLYGHITLVSYTGLNESDFIRQCKTVIQDCKEFAVTYDCIELLPPTPSIVVSPKRTRELVDMHDMLLSVAPTEMDSWSSKEVWHPHTTLFYHTEADLPTIKERMQAQFSPISATVSKLEFSRVTDHGYEIIDSVAL